MSVNQFFLHWNKWSQKFALFLLAREGIASSGYNWLQARPEKDCGKQTYLLHSLVPS